METCKDLIEAEKAIHHKHMELARTLKQFYSLYQQNRDLITIGAYSQGSDPRIDRDAWGLCVESADAALLNLPLNAEVQIRPASLCLCTVMDLGDYGNLTLRQFDPLVTYIRDHGIVPEGDIIGKILTRVHADGKMHRYIEYTIPVRK